MADLCPLPYSLSSDGTGVVIHNCRVQENPTVAFSIYIRVTMKYWWQEASSSPNTSKNAPKPLIHFNLFEKKTAFPQITVGGVNVSQ